MTKDYKELTEKVKSQGRLLEYFLIKNLFENEEENILVELKKFMNDDGGYGHGLEPDIQMPGSNVASSDIAIAILDEIKDEELKKNYVKKLVKYYENVYIKDKMAWEIVPKEVDNYPRAVWWNYDNVENFTYGNPNPEIVGFLYRYQKYLNKLEITKLINDIVEYVNGKFKDEKSQHSIVSTLYFYKSMPEDIKAKIKDSIMAALDSEIELNDFEKYCLEPYMVYLAVPNIADTYQEALKTNIEYNKQRLKKGLIEPNWQWYQYEDVFEKIKHEWSGFLTFRVLKAILEYDKCH